ncbi:hypothetical protein GCM10027051_18310 [Niabella terrae]
MKNYFLLLLSMLLSVGMQAQYEVSSIPENLLKNANMVIRADEIRIDIKSPGKAVCTRKFVYTLLNEAAAPYAVIYHPYNKFLDLKTISGTLYNAAGKKIKDVKKKDISDETGNNSGLIEDTRYKIHSFYHRVYPYTIEYTTEVVLNGLLGIPDWEPVPAPEVAVEHSSFQVTTPKNYTLRYKQFRYKGSPEIKTEKSGITYNWKAQAIAAAPDEAYMPAWEDISTRVLVAPSAFEFGGYKGDMSSWQNFGNAMMALYRDRDQLPASVSSKVHQLTDGLTDPRQKINTLYQYLQNNTHYISIQLGIGGWQPLDATYVAENKYGDCKALSNFMVALLKEAGIKAYNVLIYAGANESNIITDFPSNQFNHVVVCVPLSKDSLWLECTSQTLSPGYLGSFTGNRNALLLDDKNSRLVHTPEYSKLQNRQDRMIEANLNESGGLQAKVVTLSSGLQQDDLHHVIHNQSPEEQQKRLRNLFNLTDYDVPAFQYHENRSALVPTISERLDLVSNHYASVSGKRIFVRPNILATYTSKLSADDKRVHDIYYSYAFEDNDTVHLQLPAGYRIESLPKPVTLTNKFGKYRIRYEVRDSTIQLIRNYERNKGRFPASDYADYVDFNNTIYKADRAKMVFVKQEDPPPAG